MALMSKKLVLSLGSGGIRGFVHLGVYKALFENCIKIEALYGTSVGALVGAFISEGWTPDELIELSLNTSPLELLDFTLPRDGYLHGKKLNTFITKHIKVKLIEELPIPLTVVATRTSSGEVEYFQQGTVSDCIQASSSIPAVFRPVVINSNEYLDGDLCSPVPIKKAREDYKEAVILAVNIIPQACHAPRADKKWASLISRTIYRQTLVANERVYADIYINPVLGYGAEFSKSAAKKRIEIGYQETLAIIPHLEKLLANSGC